MVFAQNAGQWIKRHWILSAFIALFAIGGFQLYTVFYPSPFKVIDPDSPLFNPMHYESRDYRGNPEMQISAFKKAMPQGTPLAVVSKIMKNDDDCFKEGRNPDTPQIVHFICGSSLKYFGGQNRIFLFDKNDGLVDYFGSGSPGVYTDKTLEEVREDLRKGIR